jgi:cell division protein ZipA
MMEANWGLILNILLLIGVIMAMGRIMKARRKSLNPQPYQSGAAKSSHERSNYSDDIIAVRKVNTELFLDSELDETLKKSEVKPSSQPRLMPQEEEFEFKIEPKFVPKIEETSDPLETPSMLMVFLLAKENRQFAGYELLQTVLAAGLRFGEGQLFHRHQFSNGQGPVLCSLATATATGVFDLQNIGALSVRGLCLYMHPSKNPGIDKERFSIMLDTARQLSEGLDAHVLDDQRKPLTEERIVRYYHLLQINPT